MDIQQLKLLAGRIRGLLEHANVTVTHNQALDLSGALVGLRNWPEVQAFPGRVTNSELDLAAASRLAHRLQRKHEVELSARELLVSLRPPRAEAPDEVPYIWPTGPSPGVYVTTEQSHINTLLAAYDEATDGALVYAESAGSHWKTAIDLGEYGLYSSGMDSVPSGTLIVLGPLELNQQSWGETASRLENACLAAQVQGHRVAVLIDTETPDTLFHDVDLAVRLKQTEDDDTNTALLGGVSESGDLVKRSPFVEPVSLPDFKSTASSLSALPPQTVPLLMKALERCPTGILIFGSSELTEHPAIELVAAALPLTDSAGPAARIRPRHRSTPAKDWQVPDSIKQLPFLPSVQSAYSLGYRRMLITPSYTDEELLETYNDVLFIAGVYGDSAESCFMDGIRCRRSEQMQLALNQHIAILALTPVKTAKVDIPLVDMFIPDGSLPTGHDKFEETLAMIRDGRCFRAEDELERLLAEKTVTPASLRKALPRSGWVKDFLAERAKARSAEAH